MFFEQRWSNQSELYNLENRWFSTDSINLQAYIWKNVEKNDVSEKF